MARKIIRRSLAAGLVALPILPAVAQEEETGGLRLTFGIEQRLEVTDNVALEIPSEGTTTEAITRLSFGLVSETAFQSLTIGLAGDLRYADEPDEGTTSEFASPRATLTYTREAANAALSVDASYVQERLDRVDITDIEDPDDPIDPGDIDDLQGGGTRSSYTFGGTLDLNTARPLGFSLRARKSGVDYTDTTDPDLNDTETTEVGATAFFRYSPVSTARIEYDKTRFTEDDADDTTRDTSQLTFGLLYEVSPSLTLDAALGYAEIESDESGVIETETGPTALLNLTQEMRNGSAEAEFLATTDEFGTRTTLSFQRNLELRDGAFSASFGVTQGEDEDPALIGALDWRRQLRDGAVTARLSRTVVSTEDETESATTLLSMGYSKDINAISGIGLELAYAVIDEDGANRVERGDISATYRRALTEDWDMNLGARYQTRREANVGTADSPSVFFSLSRTFEFRP